MYVPSSKSLQDIITFLVFFVYWHHRQKMRLEMILIHPICRRHATFLYLTQFVKLVFILDVSVEFYDKMND